MDSLGLGQFWVIIQLGMAIGPTGIVYSRYELGRR